MDNNIPYSQNMRISSKSDSYWLAQLQAFANQFASMQVKRVEYGKQDIRGTESITLVDFNSCVPLQRHFASKKELLAFVEGYNMASQYHGTPFDVFARFKKGAK